MSDGLTQFAQTTRKPATPFQVKKRDPITFKFREWNFQKRGKAKADRDNKENKSTPIVQKLLERFSQGADMKEQMPVKTAARYIYQIYVGAAEIA